ncbi:MAG: ribonuclease III [Firmicutes bacterium]|nr:ribonuclease III [Bacillota bacterium]
MELYEYTGKNPKELSGVVLAFIGDAVFEIMVRTHVMSNHHAGVSVLHKHSRSMVNASAQAAFFGRISHFLTEDEMAIFKRGRNTNSHVPKNGNMHDYRVATGLEALFGYLYLKNETTRLNELFLSGLNEE